MAKLSDVMQSQMGEQQEQEPILPTVTAEPAKPESIIIYKLVRKSKGRVWLDGICDNVMNPKTNKRERIWLLKSADSIWQSDLKELVRDEKFMMANRRSILFEDGYCKIPSWDERAIEFADAHNGNIKVKGRKTGFKNEFYKYDPVEQAKEQYKKEMHEINMVMKASQLPIEKVKKLAMFFNIRITDDFGQYKGDDGVRTELILRAKRDPVNFEKHLESKEVEISYLVKKAISDSKIDVGGANGNAIWANGGGFIGRIPLGEKPDQYLTNLALTNSEEGRTFKEQLQTRSS